MTANQKWAIVSLGMSSAGVALLWVAGGWAAAVGGFLIYGSLNVSWSIGRDRERAWTESRLLEGPSEAAIGRRVYEQIVREARSGGVSRMGRF